ncbi:MAG: hypothetical protein ACLGPL_07215 [Acidobacteriota bacterium]
MPDWNGSVTMVGSMPHKDRSKVIDLVLGEFLEIPVWPQLACYEAEGMMVQYLEGLPCVRTEDGRVFVDTDAPEAESEIYAFYEEYLEIDAGTKNINDSRFGFGPETGKTFFPFLDALKGSGRSYLAVKGQVSGPFTLLSGLKDRQGRSTLYDERLQDLIPKHLAMKARWQVEHLKALGAPVIIFLDEPALAGYGSSAFISVTSELIQTILGEVIDAVHQAGGLAGVHVCANTDWLLAFDSGVDIINLDAYNYMDKFALYRDPFIRFMERGGVIAWGMVPTNDPAIIEQESARSLADRWLEQIRPFTADKLTVKNILAQSIFTPSCGCGSLSEPMAERVVRLTRELGEIMRGYL